MFGINKGRKYMNDRLAKQLKEAGLSWDKDYPNLSELVEACGEDLVVLLHDEGKWSCRDIYLSDFPRQEVYDTPEEAVARLWLEINKK